MNIPATTSVAAKEHCAHCGLDCPDNGIRLGDAAFCCEGCRIVYQMLADNDLDSYYCAAPTDGSPGNRAAAALDPGDFDYLEDESLLARLLDFRSDTLAIARLNIPGIHCASCVWLLENLHKLDPGVLQSEVNFMRKELLLRFDPARTSLRAVVELLHKIAYPPDIRLAAARSAEPPKTPRIEWLRLGVAGFCFGNIMLFSFPEYLAGAQGLSSEFGQLFAWLNLALSLPVLLFSAAPFFRSALTGLRSGNVNIDVPIALGIVVLFLRSLVDIALLGAPGFLDSMAALVFLLLLGRMFQRKTYDRLAFDRDYAAYFPLSVRIETTEGRTTTRSLDQLEVGDIIVVRNGELIPADALLLSDSAALDYSFVTGESAAQHSAKNDLVYAGGRLTGSPARFQTIKPVSQSYLTDLWNNGIFADEKHAGFSDLTNRFSKYFTFGVVVVAAAAGLYWALAAGDWSAAADAVTASLIVACPCALALAAPFTFGTSLGLLARRGLYVKNSETLELLAATSAIVFDKTGTLTSAEPAQLSYHGIDCTIQEAAMTLHTAQASNHPLSRGIVHVLREQVDADDLGTVGEAIIDEVPGKGLRADFYSGRQVLIGAAEWLREQGADMSGEFPTRESAAHVAVDGRYLGAFVQKNYLRRGIRAMLDKLRGAFNIFLLSGDTPQQEADFVNMLSGAFGGKQHLRFGRSPQDKLEFLDELERGGATTLMLGDGLNDAGALRRSTVGVAVVENNAAFTPASDAILEARALAALPQFLQYARRGLGIVKLSILLSLLYNVVGLTLAVQGLLSPLVSAVLMPLSSITVIVFSTLSARLLAPREVNQ